MVYWLQRNTKATSGMTPESEHAAQTSLPRRLSRAVVFLLSMMLRSKEFGRFAFLCLLVVAAASVYGIFEWLERTYPKPPRRILTGELLKGFERYSRNDKFVEKVLDAIMRAEVPKTIPCNTTACQWLETQVSLGDLSVDRPLTCQDFYEHVCLNFEGPSLYERASRDLMVQVADYLTSTTDSNHEASDVSEDVSMLQKCIDGVSDAAAFSLDCNFSARKSSNSTECPHRYPSLPVKAVHQLLHGHDVTNVREFLSRVKRYGEEYSVSVRLELGKSEVRQAMTTQRVDSFCNWLGESARCHLQERFKANDSDVRLYQKLWNELYFAPLFLGNDVSSSLWGLLDDDIDTARKMACVQIHEGLFQSDSAQAAVLVLQDTLTDVDEIASQLFHAAVDTLSMRVPTWLSRHVEGEDPRVQHQRRPKYLNELQSVQVAIVGMLEDADADYETSVYSWETRYDNGRNLLLVPQGLLALLATITDVIDPVSSVFLFAQLIRPLLPQPSGPYSWKLAHDHHLAYVTGCLRSVYNASLDFDNSPGLLPQFAYESALLGPLYDVYRRGVHEGIQPSVYLNQRYTNWQLFFVLWAMSHCGTGRDGSVLVNAAVSNSMRFGRLFSCGMGDPMFSTRKCNFWVYW